MSEGFKCVFIKNPFRFAPILKHLFSFLLAKILKRSQVFVLEIAFVQSCPVLSPLLCFCTVCFAVCERTVWAV